MNELKRTLFCKHRLNVLQALVIGTLWICGFACPANAQLPFFFGEAAAEARAARVAAAELKAARLALAESRAARVVAAEREALLAGRALAEREAGVVVQRRSAVAIARQEVQLAERAAMRTAKALSVKEAQVAEARTLAASEARAMVRATAVAEERAVTARVLQASETRAAEAKALARSEARTMAAIEERAVATRASEKAAVTRASEARAAELRAAESRGSGGGGGPGNHHPVGGTYRLVDKEGNTVYVGRTNNFERREAEHKWKWGKQGYNFDFVKETRTDSLTEQRIAEQNLYNKYKPVAEENGTLWLNKIRPVSPKSKFFKEHFAKFHP